MEVPLLGPTGLLEQLLESGKMMSQSWLGKKEEINLALVLVFMAQGLVLYCTIKKAMGLMNILTLVKLRYFLKFIS